MVAFAECISGSTSGRLLKSCAAEPVQVRISGVCAAENQASETSRLVLGRRASGTQAISRVFPPLKRSTRIRVDADRRRGAH